MHIHDEKSKKLDSKSYFPCVFVGYSPERKGFKCWDLESRNNLISNEGVFSEELTPTEEKDFNFVDEDKLIAVSSYGRVLETGS